jgi:hypothetical protein
MMSQPTPRNVGFWICQSITSFHFIVNHGGSASDGAEPI